MKKNPFTYNDPVHPDKIVFIDRKIKTEQVIEGLKEKKYFAIFSPKRSGKTTFIYDLQNKIKNHEYFNSLHYHPIRIQIGPLDLLNSGKKFYSRVLKYIIDELDDQYIIHPPKHPEVEDLRDECEKVSDCFGFHDFLGEILSNARFTYKTQPNIVIFGPPGPISLIYIIMIEGIDVLWNNFELAREFTTVIRQIYEQKNIESDKPDENEEKHRYNKYSFILSGGTVLAELVFSRDSVNSPYNIAEEIYLEDFNKEEISTMVVNALEYAEVTYYSNFLEELFQWTKGDAYLVQKLCWGILNKHYNQGDEKIYIQNNDLHKEIERILEEDLRLMSSWKMLKRFNKVDELKEILNGENIKYNKTERRCYELIYSGWVINENGYCKIRNPIYERFFYKQLERET